MCTNLIYELSYLLFLLAHSSCLSQNVHTSSHHQNHPVRPEQGRERVFCFKKRRQNYRWLPKEEPTAYEKQQRHDDDTSQNRWLSHLPCWMSFNLSSSTALKIIWEVLGTCLAHTEMTVCNMILLLLLVLLNVKLPQCIICIAVSWTE